jgi:hypothetical protein
VLGPCVSAGADGAGRGLVGTCLVGVSKAVAVSAVGRGVCGVDRGDFANTREETNGGADNRGFFFGN